MYLYYVIIRDCDAKKGELMFHYKNNKFIAVIGMLTMVGLTSVVEAQPMFSKQTGMDCTGCHLQSMPKLNKFGRKFAASGMTLSKKVSHSESDINAGMFTKSKYEKTWNLPDGKGNIQQDGTNDGETTIIRALTASVGGRLYENVGGVLHLDFRESDNEGAALGGKVVYAKEIEGGYVGAVAYTTNTSGPFAGMEFYNTGLYKPLRNFDMHKYTNANQVTKLGTRSATGLQVYYDQEGFLTADDNFFVTVGLYNPGQDNSDIELGSVIIPFGRIAYEYMIGDYNVILGAFAIKGGDTVAPDQSLSLERETYGVDLQIEGRILDREVTLAMTKVLKNKLTFTGIGAGDTELLEDIYGEAFSVEGYLSLTSDIGLKLGYMTYNDRYDYHNVSKINVKDIDNAWSVGLDYSFVVVDTPMKLAMEYAWMDILVG